MESLLLSLLKIAVTLVWAHFIFGYFITWSSGWGRLSRSFRTSRPLTGGTWTIWWPRVGNTFLTMKVKIMDDGLLLRGRLVPPFMFLGAGLHDLFIPWSEIHEVKYPWLFWMRRTRFVVGKSEGVEFEIMSSLLKGSPIEG